MNKNNIIKSKVKNKLVSMMLLIILNIKELKKDLPNIKMEV